MDKNKKIEYRLMDEDGSEVLCRMVDWDDGEDDFGLSYQAWVGGKWVEDEDACGVFIGFVSGHAVTPAFAKKWMEAHK